MILRTVLKSKERTEATCKGWNKESYSFCLKTPSISTEAADLHNPTGRGGTLMTHFMNEEIEAQRVALLLIHGISAVTLKLACNSSRVVFLCSCLILGSQM